jgi:hypothetical protein
MDESQFPPNRAQDRLEVNYAALHVGVVADAPHSRHRPGLARREWKTGTYPQK